MTRLCSIGKKVLHREPGDTEDLVSGPNSAGRDRRDRAREEITQLD